MTHAELHNELNELLYIEDHAMVDVLIASVIANSLRLGDPVWLTLIGPSSGGKSQVIRPFAKANPGFIHQLDDMTANTMISGMTGKEKSFLGELGEHGIISMDDLTVLFSKNNEARAEILSQFRMLYDGRFSKSTGGRMGHEEWVGYVGMLSGSTPSIYRYFGEVADMGERFVSYRMRKFDKDKALDFIVANNRTSKELDELVSSLLSVFLRETMQTFNPLMKELDAEVVELIKQYASHCTLLRTPVHINDRTRHVDEFPEPEMPLRVMKQLLPIAQALQLVRGRKLTVETVEPVLWVAYSLANDKRRAYFKAAVGLWKANKRITKRTLSAVTGFHSSEVEYGVASLQALDILRLRDYEGGAHEWVINHSGLRQVCERLDPPDVDVFTLVDDE